MREVRGEMSAKGKHFTIIVSRWNELITKELLDGALDELQRHGAQEPTVIHVPGTWEVPAAAAKALDEKPKPDAIIALGCILMGQTPHAKLLNADVGKGLMDLQVASKTPIAWGILTPENMDQAYDRAGLKLGNKGREAALAAIEMVSVMHQLES